MKYLAIFVCVLFVFELTSAAVLCPTGYEGPIVRGCNDRGVKCICEKRGVACVPLCPLSQPPYPNCRKEYLPPHYKRNLTTGEGCCSDWECPDQWGDIQARCANTTGNVDILSKCMSKVPMKYYCENGTVLGATDMCPPPGDFNPHVCTITRQTGIPWNTYEGCCPKIWCPWYEKAQDEVDGVDDSYLV